MRLAALTGILIAGGIGLYLVPGPQSARLDPFTSGSIVTGEAREYAVANLRSGEVCLVRKGRAVTASASEFDADIDCEAVWSGLSSAATWSEQDDGLVVLADRSGHALVSLAPGDGVAFEAMEPANADLSLTVVQ
ncbi:hypothetical protein [Rhizobium sp. L1K21]|uniref:hypothetical protein n=1 Tax=Rhizobium sp. L1K21 TaxID=2954933 RepID=UPI0020929D11|nr:hypothetical protein [Rhizobium sp. L1K21]MCO6185018.1 hypothetical protein [Rhizobium sp. L1K21]